VPDRVSTQQTWFDYPPENGQQFKELVGRLHDTERNYMDREVVVLLQALTAGQLNQNRWERLPPTHDTQPPDSQFHVVYDIATTLKL
jgi:hypothetical protein